ncbi:MAG: VCBS repeat-containing protein [Gemmataceae bacterium]
MPARRPHSVRLSATPFEDRSSPVSLDWLGLYPGYWWGGDPYGGWGSPDVWSGPAFDPFGGSYDYLYGNPFDGYEGDPLAGLYDPFSGWSDPSFGYYLNPFAGFGADPTGGSFLTDPLYLTDPFYGTPVGFAGLFDPAGEYGLADLAAADRLGLETAGFNAALDLGPGGADAVFAVGGDAGGGLAGLLGTDGGSKLQVAAYPAGVDARVATGDVTGDGVADLVTAPGPGAAPIVKVFSGADGSLAAQFAAFEESFQGGVFVDVADLNQDGRMDLLVTPDQGGGPRVRVLDGATLGTLADFYGIDDPNFRGGARVAAGDVSGDGLSDLVVSAGFGGGPRIAVFDGGLVGASPVKLVPDFFAFEDSLRNGAYVSAGDLNTDGRADLVFGGGPGGAPRVLALDGAGLLGGAASPLANFFAGDTGDRSGVRVGVAPGADGRFGIAAASASAAALYSLSGTAAQTYDPFAGAGRAATVSSAPVRTTSSAAGTAVAGTYRNRYQYVSHHQGFVAGNSNRQLPNQDVTVSLSANGTGSATVAPFGFSGRGQTFTFRYTVSRVSGGTQVRVTTGQSGGKVDMKVTVSGRTMTGWLTVTSGSKQIIFSHSETAAKNFRLTKV